MLETAVHTLLVDVPRAAVIWLLLLAGSLIVLAGLFARPGPARPQAVEQIREAARRRGRKAMEAHDLARYAEEVAVAAKRAAASAERRRAQWLAVQDESEAAWAAFDAAEASARRLAGAAVFPTPRTPRTAVEYADRERFLHRAAMAACAHRELPALELPQILSHRGGWDPRRHPVEQEVVLRRAVRDLQMIAYRDAAARERRAWEAAQRAADASAALRREAAVAAERARQARRWLVPGDVAPAGAAPAARRPERAWRKRRRVASISTG